MRDNPGKPRSDYDKLAHSTSPARLTAPALSPSFPATDSTTLNRREALRLLGADNLAAGTGRLPDETMRIRIAAAAAV